MNFYALISLLALAPPPAQPGQPQPSILQTLGPMILIMVIFYFVLLYPQQKKAKELDKQLKSAKAGDKITTSGGIVATIITVKEGTLMVRSADSKFEILKTAVTAVTERASETSES